MLALAEYQRKKDEAKYHIYINQDLDNEIAKSLESSLTAKGKENLDFILENKIDISELLTTYDLIEETNQELSEQDYYKYAFIGYSVANNSLTQGYSRYNKSLKNILESYSALNMKLPELKKMSQNHSGSYKKNFRDIAHYETKHFENRFNEAKKLKVIENNRSFKYGEYRSKVHQNRYNSKNVEIYVGSKEDVSKLTKIVNFGRVAQNGLFTVGVVTGSYEVYQAYQNGEDPYRKTTEITGSAVGGILGGASGGYVAGILIGVGASNPIGWAGIWVYAVVAGIGAYMGSGVGEWGFGKIYDKV